MYHFKQLLNKKPFSPFFLVNIKFLTPDRSLFTLFTTIGYYFLDRTPTYFGMVLSYLRDGRLELRGKSSFEIELIKEEFDFFLITVPQFMSKFFNIIIRFFVIVSLHLFFN